MHIILIILLVIAFAYSLALVVLNNQAITVNLLFSQVADMSLGLVLVATIFLGVLIGILLALLIFRVFQNKWEISRLKKEVNTVQAQLTDANLKLAEQAKQLEMARQNDTLAAMTETTVNAPQQQVGHTQQ
ncbi:LapA family protein [Moraxella sp. FZLJ2107]|uniref:LapA family protein n=1 Tax=unclassified Moraxella TaxID=2685852 RepID=UPI00209C43EE|nr:MULTISPECIES: LapA family protein [unclassified Moraxella]USZ14568.1 LapA family protein [Moraxella sp. FZFQ2102]UTO05240.1 LapA family protein [Moraxella sp. FZLJ2107]UTO21975.1 LapA family protein [Moraxella sp. FZLJ2109]